MIQLPYRFNKLSIDLSNIMDDVYSPDLYYVEDENGNKTQYIVDRVFPLKNGTIIVDADEDYRYYRRVQLDNGRFSFLDDDGKLIPFEFNIASGFNEYGFAMVGTSGGVTWINRDFKRLNSLGNWVPLNSMALLASSVSEFDSGLSALEFKPIRDVSPFYITTDGKRKNFTDEKGYKINYLKGDYEGDARFEKGGYKITSKGVYFISGRFLNFAELIKYGSFNRALIDINKGFIKEDEDKSLLLEQINPDGN